MRIFWFKILSCFMALNVLASAFSFAVAQHYCGEDLVDFSFFGKAESCGMDMQQPSDSHQHKLQKKQCCDDETLSVQGNGDLLLSVENLSVGEHQFLVAFTYSYINLFEGLQENIVSVVHYPPPLLVKDIQILDQTFLI